MDESGQLFGSDALQDLESNTTGKETADEDIAKESPKQSSNEDCNNEVLNDELNLNGIDKKIEAYGSDNVSQCDLESTQCSENFCENFKSVSYNVPKEFELKQNEENNDTQSILKEHSDTTNDFSFISEISEKQVSKICAVNETVENERQTKPESETKASENDLEKQNIENNKKNNISDKLDLCETNELNKSTEIAHISESFSISEVNEKSDDSKNKELTSLLDVKNDEIENLQENVKLKTNLVIADKISKSSDSSGEELSNKVNSETVLKNEKNFISPKEESFDPKNCIHITDNDSTNEVSIHDSIQETSNKKVNFTEDIESENIKISSTEHLITQKSSVSAEKVSVNRNSAISSVKETKNEFKNSSSDCKSSTELVNTSEEAHSNKTCEPEDFPKVSDSSNDETQNTCNEDVEDEQTQQIMKMTNVKKTENLSFGSPKNLETQQNIKETIKLNKDSLNLCQNLIDDQEASTNEKENLGDDLPDVESNNDELFKTNEKQTVVSVESEKDLDKSESVEGYNSQESANISSTSADQEEEKLENDGNEVMDTELVNCNEIEQIDLSESESDLKGENRDYEMVSDSLETICEKSTEDQISDGREDSRETDKSEMLVDHETVNQPGSSEEETITGDTTNQSASDLGKEKDEEVCIIPDDVLPSLSILPQNKMTAIKDEEKTVETLRSSTTESGKPKTRGQEKRGQAGDIKPRPVRNAAKLAGNKIKSLVENDMVVDESNLSETGGRENFIHENTDGTTQMCAQCRELKICKLQSVQNDVTQYLCSEQCSAAFKAAAQMDVEPTEAEPPLRGNVRKCCQCQSQITMDENRLFWETMDFCNEDCLGKYQFELGSNCSNCKKTVPSISLGKYCVRFGYDIKQFCSALCLEEYKKGLKVCSYCQKDISSGTEGFLAPVGSKGQFKDFCTQSCMEKYERMSSSKPLPEVIEECAVCSNSKPVQVEVDLESKTHKLCSEPCFAAFKFVNNITEGQCDMCQKYFDRAKTPNYSLRLLFYDENIHSFCSKTCMNVYILANRKIVPCNWCKVKKYNFDMIKKISSDGQLSMMCSLNCLMLYQTSVNAVCSKPIKCDFCKKKFVRQPLYHLTMSDATLRNFCSYNCVMSFQSGYPKHKIDVMSGTEQLSSPIPTDGPKRLAAKRSQVESTCVPVISSVQSLASPNGPVSPTGRVQISRDVNIVPQVSQPLSVPTSPVPAPTPQIYQQIITKPAPAKQMKNKSVLCKPYSHTKGVSCRPHPCMKETQTDQSLNRKFLIPIPVPIYVPAPMHMFATPFPVPVPFPLPIPVPIFIPTTRNSAKGIMKEIKKIQEKIPTDPFEAELLMMAEMVAGDKKQDPTDSESEDGNEGDDNNDGTFSPENVDTSNTFGDDMLQMALKMASELEEPAVDMESVLTSNTITTSTQPAVDPSKGLYASDTDDPDQVNVMTMNRGRKRSVRGARNSSGGTPSKRGRRTSGSVEVPLLPPPEPVAPRTIEVEKPDANMCLKYTFGVNAWRHWVMQKNAELEKAAMTNRKIKLFKPELLQLTADELNFSLCLFVKEVRKPNGTEYAPDTIYYLCLGIQQYLFENGRIDNIFTDSYYEKFTDCLDEVAKKFAALYNDSQFIVTRVEEEHLWESKQLGAHSPHVLLSTLMFFNTKHFNLVTVEEHMQLSFSHIMKHWKRNPNTPGVAKVPGSRNVLLRFYPPQSALEANSRKKKVYEQQENEENPLRCPVKLYEFYLSKCPESVKTRNDVFYLLPERSCVPDSPVWYSTMALGKEPLMKMLHRIKMVKEINIALLTS